MQTNNLSLASVIDDLKLVKRTAAGKDRWRFSVMMDCSGWIVGTPGWVYLPHAKPGYRVNPPHRGLVRTITGVGRDLAHVLEKAVEAKLRARGGSEALKTSGKGIVETAWDEYTPEELEELEELGMKGEL